ncbi:DUF6907 domain-containing protein [Streptomyces sp. NEAU-Y11]|uniref:DUF6907 domain-containing protein n=1 Tax=Streptomyces cucumeris TaxID=2962890 RepID=UPI0020C9101D|nr:hypothetical protein [Streptomyces sp. NEAU-Y11]MCP9209312.1 hypothetical protein [Streptomyces sp. NEAU-Y11]
MNSMAQATDSGATTALEPATTAPALPPCVFCKKPGADQHTSEQGTPFTTCADCTGAYLISLTPEFRRLFRSTDVNQVRVTAPGATDSLIVAEPFTGDGPNPRTVVSVYSEADAGRDLDAAGLTQLISRMQTALPGMRALRDQLAAIEQETPAVPALPVAPPTWTMRTHDGDEHTETCPAWCTTTEIHQRETESTIHPSDIWHQSDHVAMPLVLTESRETYEDLVLIADVAVIPHSDEPEQRIPHVNVQMIGDQDFWTGPMGPDEFGTVIDRLAAHVDQLRAVHARLVQARAEWQARA